VTHLSQDAVVIQPQHRVPPEVGTADRPELRLEPLPKRPGRLPDLVECQLSRPRPRDCLPAVGRNVLPSQVLRLVPKARDLLGLVSDEIERHAAATTATDVLLVDDLVTLDAAPIAGRDLVDDSSDRAVENAASR